ncbi:MAG: carboxylesterase family protein, partial [Sphingomonas sp.]
MEGGMRRISTALTLGLISMPAIAVAQRAQVDTGTIAGTRIAAPTGVDAYLGIPYAAPPIGALRWQPPKPAARWSDVRKADAFGARCMQQPLYA